MRHKEYQNTPVFYLFSEQFHKTVSSALLSVQYESNKSDSTAISPNHLFAITFTKDSQTKWHQCLLSCVAEGKCFLHQYNTLLEFTSGFNLILYLNMIKEMETTMYCNKNHMKKYVPYHIRALTHLIKQQSRYFFYSLWGYTCLKKGWHCKALWIKSITKYI